MNSELSTLRQAFAPTGALRASINFGNPILASKGDRGPQGVSVDLATELARQLGVPLTCVVHDSAGASVDTVRDERADVGFFAIDPKRGEGIAFTVVGPEAPLAAGIVKLLLDGQQRMTSLYGVVRGRPPEFFDGNAQAFTGLRFHLETQTFEFYQPVKMKDDPLWIDVTELMLNQAIRLRDLPVSPKWKPVTEPDTMLVHVVLPKAEEAAAAADAAPTAGAEPEVIKKGKKEEAYAKKE